MSSLFDHPGYLGYGGVLAIHADWPAYPFSMEWESALLNFGQFPIGTRFFKIDDIDMCVLFLTRDPSGVKDNIYSPKYFHLAAWHESLNTLQENGFITGILPSSQYEWELEKFKRMVEEVGYETNKDGDIIVTRDRNGELVTSIIKKPHPDDYEREGFARIEGHVTLTSAGIQEIERMSKNLRISEDIWSHSSPFITIRKYDTAIRETVLFIETRIRKLFSSAKKNEKPLHGAPLVDAHIAMIEQKFGNNRAWIKNYKNEIRSLFSFTRNDFMHNFKDLEEAQTKVILARIDGIYQQYLDLERGLTKSGN
jgi:hypothetical protein